MRSVLSLAMLAVVLAGCGMSTAAKSGTRWDRERFLRAQPTSGAATPRTSAPSPTDTPTAATAEVATFGKRVGALFAHDTTGDHFCTAGAVDSPGGDLIITAAHCIHGGKGTGYLTDLVYVPAYHDGTAPYGVWRVRTPVVDDRWANESDPDLDVGFAVLDPLNGHNVADLLGANPLGVNEGFRNLVRVTGYPLSAEKPITCVNTTTQEDTYQVRFACKGYFPGTSGSPWLAGYDPATQRGDIVGVIGGFHQGGYADTVSYSSYFDGDVKRLYDTAVRASAQR